jgi:hypothetical protein
MIHFELMLVQGERLRSSFDRYWCNPVSPEPFAEEAIFSPKHILGSIIKNKVIIAAWVYVWGLLFYWSSCLFWCKYHAGFDTVAV